jgi:outer membrane protein TolC
MKLKFKHLIIVALGVMLASCATYPNPLLKKDMLDIAKSDWEKSLKEYPVVTGSLTLEEAIARALKYNLDQRVALLEQAQASGQLDASRFDMLPKVIAGAGYSWRDENLTRKSVDSVTGELSTGNPYISSDRQHSTSDITFSWSLLDFGASYYTSKQQSDRVLIMSERRRKVTLNVIRNVRTAYWKALASQKLRNEVKGAIDEVESAIIKSVKIETERVKAPVETLRYQRTLLENLRLMEAVERELSIARIDLASLIGLPPNQAYTLVEPEGALAIPALLQRPVEDLEATAIANNPDLKETFYNARIAALETRRTLLKLLPGLSFDYGIKHDGDSYLINQQWQDAGFKVSFNLLNLLSAPTQMKAAKSAVKVAEARRMALQMSLLTQLHLSVQMYNNAQMEYRRIDAISRIDNKLAEFSKNQESSQTGSALDRISSRSNAILSLLRRYQAIAKTQETASALQAVLGAEPFTGSLEENTLPQLTKKISDFLNNEIIVDPLNNASPRK